MVLAACDCKHPFQDEKYGQGVRVHNLMNGGKADAATGLARGRCTVCGKERVVKKPKED